ncbi:hypothetical protein CCR94_12410 [Rhodoblastus sphagnicola]|uniref:Uncharacterized protein n=2 Tax=Rhodoblastus sphagnicola TaxID=333368 RepID=A0A2S6N7C3_9HYPH|nr:hypothetical protein CCR94_12410 [Rhodoblastus sphagnicola]
MQNQLRERVRKVEALKRGAVTDGEREAAEAALARLKARLGDPAREKSPEAISLGLGAFSAPWPVPLFLSMGVIAIAMASSFAMIRASATRRPL